MEAGKERLTRDAVRDATQQEVHQLKRENVELKQLVAELSLEGYRLKKRELYRILAQRPASGQASRYSLRTAHPERASPGS